MNPATFIPPLAADAAPIIRKPAQWTAPGSTRFQPASSGHGAGVGAFCLVALLHLGLLALALTQVLAVSVPEQAAAGANGPLRVRLVSSPTEPSRSAPAQPAPIPPQVRPEKKLLAAEAPARRAVEVSPPKPDPAPVVQPVAATEPVSPPQPALASAVTAPGPASAAAGKPDALDLGAAPKEVGQVSCVVPKPEYPRSARRRGEAGTVSIRLVMDARGQVTRAEVEHSSGFPDLDASARRAALAAQCQPYRDNGRAISVSALQPFQFLPSD